MSPLPLIGQVELFYLQDQGNQSTKVTCLKKFMREQPGSLLPVHHKRTNNDLSATDHIQDPSHGIGRSVGAGDSLMDER